MKKKSQETWKIKYFDKSWKQNFSEGLFLLLIKFMVYLEFFINPKFLQFLEKYV